MGTFRVSIAVGDPRGERFETVEALVDTGATYATLPAPLLQSLGVVRHARDIFVLADGRRVERDIGRTWIRVDERAELTLVVFGEPGTQPLLGAYALEGLRLAADPVARRLTPAPGLLLTNLATSLPSLLRAASGPSDAGGGWASGCTLPRKNVYPTARLRAKALRRVPRTE